MEVDNVAETLSPVPIIPQGVLKKYTSLKAKQKELENETAILNKEIKLELGKWVLSNIKCAVESNLDLVTKYQEERMLGQIDSDTLVALEAAGITTQMIDDYEFDDPYSVLAHNPFTLDIEGYSVRVSVQDKSTLDQDKAVAYLRNIKREDLIQIKYIVNETAMTLAIEQGEIDAESFKEKCVKENLITALYIK